MAIIENKQNNTTVMLHCQHTVGRASNNTSCIDKKDISRKHAIIYWEKYCWKLTDFSSNGTKVNGKYLHHATKKLQDNDRVQFSNDEEQIWQIINLDPPNSFFKAINDKEPFIDLSRGIVSTGLDENLSFFLSRKKQWIMDNGINETLLIHKNKYCINKVMYEFIENKILSETLLNTDITKDACFQLLISIDEESITSKIKINDLELDLGNRVFNHLLLYLVRIKQHDVNFGINDKLCGWVSMEELHEALSKELLKEVDAYYINTLIHRLRKNLMNLPPYGFLFANIIERKKGKLRFGLSKFEIEKERALA